MYRNSPLSLVDAVLSRVHPSVVILVALAGVVTIGVADYYTGYEMSLASLYLLPIFTVAWPMGMTAAVVMAVVCAIAWFLSTLFSQPPDVPLLIDVWDASIRLAVFILFGLLIARLKIALDQADDRFVTVLEGLDAAVYVSDSASGELLYANRRFHEDFADAATRPELDSGREQSEHYDSATSRWYLVKCRALRWTDGRRVRLQLAADITERKHGEALFRAQQEKIQLAARLAMAGELASTIAHELNQPLGAIRNYIVGCVRWLKARDFHDAEVLAALENAAGQAERAAAVIQRLRSMVARRPGQAEACDINAVIEQVASLVEAEAQERGIKVALDLAPRVPTVRIDLILLQQVLLNLARNAFDAMEDTPPAEKRVDIRSRQDAEGQVVVEVQDHGCGIDRQLAQNLFTPFFSTKAHGMGLGLHICRSIIEAHGGHITIRPGDGGGSNFAFSLDPSYA